MSVDDTASLLSVAATSVRSIRHVGAKPLVLPSIEVCTDDVSHWPENPAYPAPLTLQVVQWNLAQLANAFVKGELLDIVRPAAN